MSVIGELNECKHRHVIISYMYAIMYNLRAFFTKQANFGELETCSGYALELKLGFEVFWLFKMITITGIITSNIIVIAGVDTNQWGFRFNQFLFFLLLLYFLDDYWIGQWAV